MRYLTLGEVVELHRRLLEATGGASGTRDPGVIVTRDRGSHINARSQSWRLAAQALPSS